MRLIIWWLLVEVKVVINMVVAVELEDLKILSEVKNLVGVFLLICL